MKESYRVRICLSHFPIVINEQSDDAKNKSQDKMIMQNKSIIFTAPVDVKLDIDV